jgi:RNA polymerase sigma factor (sigma-70 family)
MPDPNVAAGPPSPEETDPHGLAPLLSGARAGDRTALDALLGKLRPYVHALVRACLGPEPPAAIDQSDLVQKGLVRIYRNIGCVCGPGVPQLLGWVGTIVRRLVIDARRALPRVPVPASRSRLLELLARGLPPGEEDHRDGRALRVAEALARLPQRRRQVIEWSLLEELDDDEIGRRLGGSVAAVRVLRCRALQDLRRLLGGVAGLRPREDR